MRAHPSPVRAAVTLLAVAAAILWLRLAHADTALTQPLDTRGFKVFNLSAPGSLTEPFRKGDLPAGPCVVHVDGTRVTTCVTLPDPFDLTSGSLTLKTDGTLHVVGGQLSVNGTGGLIADAPLVFSGLHLQLTLDGTSIGSSAGALRLLAGTGAVTWAAGSTATSFGTAGAHTVLGVAGGSIAVPTFIGPASSGDFFGNFAGTLGWGSVPWGSVSGAPTPDGVTVGLSGSTYQRLGLTFTGDATGTMTAGAASAGLSVLAAEFGAQRLTFSTTADGALLKRSGTTVAPAVQGTDYVVTVRADGLSTGSVQLASISAANMVDGAIAWVDSVGDYFRLVQAALSTDGITVIAAAGKTGYQWHRIGALNVANGQIATWYVDPTSGNDENNGTSSGTALKSFAELNRRMSGQVITASKSVILLNDALDSDGITLNVYTTNGSSITIAGTLSVVSTQTVTSAQAKSTSLNRANELTVTSFNWAPFVGTLLRVQGTSEYAAVTKAVSTGVGRISELLNGLSGIIVGGVTTGQVVELVTQSKGPLAIENRGNTPLHITDMRFTGTGAFHMNDWGSSTTLLTRTIVRPTGVINISSKTGILMLSPVIGDFSAAPVSGFFNIDGGAYIANGTSRNIANITGQTSVTLVSFVTEGGQIQMPGSNVVIQGDIGQFDVPVSVAGPAGIYIPDDLGPATLYFNQIVGSGGTHYGSGNSGTYAWYLTPNAVVNYNSAAPPTYDGGSVFVNGASHPFSDLPIPISPFTSSGAVDSTGAPADGNCTNCSVTIKSNVVTAYSSGATPALASTTVQGTAPVAIAGDHSAHDLSANRVWSLDANGVTYGFLQQGGALSIPGRAANSTGNWGDIPAVASSGCVYRESSSTLGCGSITEGIVLNLTADLAAKALGTRTLIAGLGLTGGGDLTADRTFDVGANADGSIVVNANDIQVGVLATDAQHGARGGGAQHAVATTSVAGFESAADKAKLDGIAAGATVGTVYTGTSPIVVSGSAISCPTCGTGTGSGSVTTVTGTSPIVITSTPTTTPNVTIQGAIIDGTTGTSGQNLGSLSNGTLQQTVSGGHSTISAFNGTAASVAFYTSSGQLAQDNANFSYASTTLSLGGATPLSLFASGTQNISKSNGALGILTTGADAINLATASAVRFTVDGSGNTFVSALATGGVVKSLPSTGGQLGLASGSDIAAALGMPAATELLISTGSSTAPTGNAGLTFASGNLILGNSVKLGGLAGNSVLFTDSSGFAATDGSFFTYNSSTHQVNTWLLHTSSTATIGGDLTTFGAVQFGAYAGGSGGPLRVDGSGNLAVGSDATADSMHFYVDNFNGLTTTTWMVPGPTSGGTGLAQQSASVPPETRLSFTPTHVKLLVHNLGTPSISGCSTTFAVSKSGSAVVSSALAVTNGTATNTFQDSGSVSVSASSTDSWGVILSTAPSNGSVCNFGVYVTAYFFAN